MTWGSFVQIAVSRCIESIVSQHVLRITGLHIEVLAQLGWVVFYTTFAFELSFNFGEVLFFNSFFLTVRLKAIR